MSISCLEDGALIHGPPTMVLVSQDAVVEVPKLQIDGHFDLCISEDFQSL